MASPGAMAEFARLPPARKALVFVLLGLVIGLGYWKLVYKPLDEQVERAQADHDRKVQTARHLADDLARYEELKAHLSKLRELIEKNQTALPKEAEVPAFFETLQRKVAESGVEIHRWSKRNEEPIESFVKVPVEIELTGTFMQIKRFFASLIQRDVRVSQSTEDRASEPRERIVSIENLALGSPTVRNRELILTARFTAVTFRQEDAPPPPDRSANGQPAAGAARPPGGRPVTPVSPSPAPPPPAPMPSTPPLPTTAPSPSTPPLPTTSSPPGTSSPSSASPPSASPPGASPPGASPPAAGTSGGKAGLP